MSNVRGSSLHRIDVYDVVMTIEKSIRILLKQQDFYCSRRGRSKSLFLYHRKVRPKVYHRTPLSLTGKKLANKKEGKKGGRKYGNLQSRNRGKSQKSN